MHLRYRLLDSPERIEKPDATESTNKYAELEDDLLSPLDASIEDGLTLGHMTLEASRKRWMKWDYSRVATTPSFKKSLDSWSRLLLTLNRVGEIRSRPG